MIRLREVVYVCAAATVFGSVPARACHVQIHYTKAQINAAHIALYEHELKLQDKNPTGFDRAHPLLGALLANQGVYGNLVQQFESHPQQFEQQNPFLSKVLEGDTLYQEKHPLASAVLSKPVNLISSQQGGQGNPDIGGSGSLGDPDVASVPEPSTGLLMLFALIAGAMLAASRRAVNCLRPLT
jgi:hypothetical protein